MARNVLNDTWLVKIMCSAKHGDKTLINGRPLIGWIGNFLYRNKWREGKGDWEDDD